ncbi:DAK2 domain-containing protein [Streptomyces lycii]|uniref:DAK2 domain-containing protein n=1 Tax=Streptomyces lycii TaxID=2654337 RepID=A0ABQ7FMT3_9ACTN|nr:DAK2 domain-containing protein [Streptomyces lycii]KAF4409086.1 DAK2 domain-containing protein [Streptomyces lycii]
MPDSLDATVVRSWCGLALEALGKAREGIDAINVYPVADGDTGTNLYFTAESAAHAVQAVFAAHTAMAAPGPDTATGASPAGTPTLSEALRAMAHGALIGARGNSGTILAQLLRGMTEVLAAEPGERPHSSAGGTAAAGTGPAPGTEGRSPLADRPGAATTGTPGAAAPGAGTEPGAATGPGASAGVTDATDATEATDGADGTDGSEVAGVTVADAAHVTGGTDAAGATGVPDAAPVTEVTEVTEVDEVTEVRGDAGGTGGTGGTGVPAATGAGARPGAAGRAEAARGDGELLRRALRRAADAAYQAVAHPVEGTVLTVAAAAADAAERAGGDSAGAVARAAHAGACAALDATPEQLGVLARAGVVDAGGCGLVTVLGALVEALTGEAPRTTGPHRPRTGAPYGDPRAASGAERDGHQGHAGPAGLTGHAGLTGCAEDTEPPGNPRPPGPTEPSGGTGATAGPPPDGRPRTAGDVPGTPGGTPVDSPADTAADRAPDEAADRAADRPGEKSQAHEVKSPAYEVIYLLDAADEAVSALRSRLDALGDSLVVVGGDGLWNVHVHVDDAGAAVEAGIEAGRPHRVRITHFGADCATGHPAATRPAAAAGPGTPGAGADRPGRERAVAAVVPGDGLAALCREAGATVVTARPGEPPAAGELVDAVRRTRAREVVLLPNDPALRHTAAAAAEQARAEGVRVAVIPTRSAVQGIAALAVHEPGRRFDEDVVAMTSAAGATRCAELAVAEHRSWTSAGICQAGDVLGLIDGDVAVIGQELADTAESVLDRMLAAGGEMVTLVLGAGVPDALADRLETRVRNGHLAVDTVVYRGGQASVPLLIGVE